MRLPDKFIHQMSEILGDEVQAFLDSYEEDRHYGLRINPLKAPEGLEKLVNYDLKPMDWCEEGFYYDEADRPAKDAYYAAGCYYIQEPSAMTPATAIDAQPGDLVIDLCAAPGGKTTQIAGQLFGEGLIVTNDISPSRVKTLNKNVQRSGIRNGLVLSEDPVKLADRWPQVFDRVLVDAPCSGEGMFRKDPKLIAGWVSDGPETYIEVQRSILDSAHRLLKPGGVLVYSTCTYNIEEDEGNIQWFLNEFHGYKLVPLAEQLKVSEGISIEGNEALSNCARVWPQRHTGEGHFIAKLIKKEDRESRKGIEGLKIKASCDVKTLEAIKSFILDVGITEQILPLDRLNRVKDTVYLLPEIALDNKGFRTFSNGWLLGTMKRERFEPSQAFASGLNAKDVKAVVDYKHDNENVIRYLKGETVQVEASNGWHLVAVEGSGLGWGKVVNKRLKNKLEPSWRWQ